MTLFDNNELDVLIVNICKCCSIIDLVILITMLPFTTTKLTYLGTEFSQV